MLDIQALFTPLTGDEVLAAILAFAASTGLQTTAWQPGQPGREQLFVVSQKIADTLAIVQTMNKGGFFDYAASVTPEGGPGWLDILAASQRDVFRIPAKQAITPVVFTCVGATANTYAVGTVHLAAGAITYTNAVALVVPANGTVTIDCVSDLASAKATVGAGAINTIVSPALIGVTCSNPSAAIGSDAETNANLVKRCRAKLASLSLTGPAGAYAFHATTINGDEQVKVSSGPLTQPAAPVTRASVAVTSGVVTTYVANASGAYATPPNYTNQLPENIVSSTNASPISVHLPAHGYTTGDRVYIANHDNLGALGGWTIIVTGVDDFTLTGSTGTSVGGAVGTAYRYSDLDLVDKSIQANARPLATTATTQTATGVNPAIVGVITVTGPTASLSDAAIIANALTSLEVFAENAPLSDGTASTDTINLEEIRATIFAANPHTKNVALSSPVADIALATGSVFEVSPTIPAFTVVRV